MIFACHVGYSIHRRSHLFFFPFFTAAHIRQVFSLFFSFVIYVKKQQLRHSIRPAAFWMATYGTHEEKRSEKTYDKLWPEIQIRAKMRERKTEF